MGVHKTEKYDLFGHLKRNKHDVLTILRKHKHKKSTISEFVKDVCNFQYFERNYILFLSRGDWIKRQEQLNIVRKCSTRKVGDHSNSIQKLLEGTPIFNEKLDKLKTIVNDLLDS